MRNYFKTALILILLFFPILLMATIENIDDAGFVPGPIWFSKYPVFVGDKVKIYTALYNNSDYKISGEIYFLNNKNEIGVVNFEMMANSGAKNISIDWIASQGEIEIEAEIKNVKIADGQEVIVPNVDFENKQIAKNTIFVDFDNDKDGIGNIADSDDDNDGKNDLAEIAEGTNPFEADQKISSSSPEEELFKENEDSDEQTVLDKIDDSVMGFLNKITKNKIDEYIDNLGQEQVQKLEIKKEELEGRLEMTVENNLNKISTQKSTTTNVSETPEANMVSSRPRSAENTEIKNNISHFFQTFFSKIYLYAITGLIFLLNHPVFLFLVLFFIVYFLIRKLIRFFIY